MFHCYAHNWSHHLYACPLCTTTTTTGSASMYIHQHGPAYYDLVVRLEKENARLRDALKSACSCRPGGFECPACRAIEL